ncbi:MAG TPA: hypothetical protein VK970_16510, partial [Candidatus Methylacidiphilales bacterium]|nr:hypothetical protein [Candidatus Methylacidiphilales bacterium]
VTATLKSYSENMKGLPKWQGATERLTEFDEKEAMPSYGMVASCRNCARETNGKLEVSEEGFWDSD